MVTPVQATWRRKLELAVGGVQLRAMTRAMVLAAGFERGAVAGDLQYYARPGRGGLLPLVGIHGFGGDKETWLLTAALVPRARGVALIDLPGHGTSADVPEERASIRHHAEAVLRVLDQLRIERAILCGNSMGGGVSMRLALMRPDRVAGLVLVSSIGRDVHTSRAQSWLTGVNPLIPTEADIEQFLATVLKRPPPVGRAVIRYVITQRARRADVLRTLFRGMILADGDAGMPRELGGIAQPALVIHGTQDDIIDLRVAEDLARELPNAELVVMRGVGHVPQIEAPRHTARLIEKFARALEAR